MPGVLASGLPPPGVPDIPEVLDIPEAPDIPGAPGVPDILEVPALPELPDILEVPDIPDEPPLPGVLGAGLFPLWVCDTRDDSPQASRVPSTSKANDLKIPVMTCVL